ncbi:MAG TPA: glycosyl hydrolase [Bacteroidetes bacterium]|nr:glycosyl hydrolase [Bacteroidota bacterium]
MNRHVSLQRVLPGILLCIFTWSIPVWGTGKKEEKKSEEEGKMVSSTFSGLKWRSIGPAFSSGRISDFAVNPRNHSEWFVAVASGHVWKTENNGTTFKPVFDNYGAYAMGCLAMDPHNPNVVWLGTGENNHQRALGYGNGVYKTTDGGKSWKNMGLKESRQIGMIAIHPENTDVVFVAAEGSAWGPGGDRGLYKTTDGGETWKKVLEISENTGVNNVIISPWDPEMMFATSEQRRRHVFTKIGGGPESAIYKSTDGGETWKKLTKGLPGGHVGGIGIAASPVKPGLLYAIIEAEGETGGFFRSTDMGESWEKMSDHHSSGQYYNEIVCDPCNPDKVYSLETRTHYTLDGGKTWTRLSNNSRHVDDHALWIDPDDTKHFLIGGDGGVYETFDGGVHYVFKSNLPVTQFYRVAVDNSEPFYWIYGGTQDNNSMGGPSRNLNSAGVANDEWIVTVGGDGFWQAIDPTDPNIVYSEWQYGNSVRYDKRSGEVIDIKPQPRQGEETYRWNWDAPLILSPHSHTRLYAAANKVFRSDDRGNSWTVISDDLTRDMDRNTWQVMGKYWSVDAVAKDVSTSQFGTIVALAESEVKEGLIYVGTDDGLIQVTENGGETWTKTAVFPGVPEYTYVSDICPSKFNENVVFASFNNHKRDDFKPYVLKSTDKGKTWTSIAANLPENGSVHSIEQDFVNPDLLFVGTEFSFYFSTDGGKKWIKLASGLPDIAVRDIAIQRRESDLVLGTFGRGFFVLDDYSPLRQANPDLFEKKAHIFPVKKADMYIPADSRYGQGSTYFLAPNPEYGAAITYYLKEPYKTERQRRREKEKELFEKGEKIPILTPDELRKEGMEEKPHLLFTIYDTDGQVVKKIRTSASSGIHRIHWDLRNESPLPARMRDGFDPLAGGQSGFLVMPDTYRVSLSEVVQGKETLLVEPVEFRVESLHLATLEAKDRRSVVEFQEKAAELFRKMRGAINLTQELSEKTDAILQTLYQSPGATPEMIERAKALRKELDDIQFTFYGHEAKASWEEVPPQPMPLTRRMSTMAYTHNSSTADITETEKEAYRILMEEFPPVLEKIRRIGNTDIPALEKMLEEIKAPWTPGRDIQM